MKKIFSLLLITVFLSSSLYAAKPKKNKKIKPGQMKTACAPAELEKGVLFSYKNDKAKTVSLAGSFNEWNAEKNPLKKNKNNIWYIVIPLKTGTIQYKFVVDGKDWIIDPANKKTADDGYGGANSVFEVIKNYNLGGVDVKDGKVIFSYFAPKAASVSLAGSMNNWDAKADPMIKQADGFWVIKKVLPPGRYQYKYVVDSQWIADPMNENTADDGYGGKNSLVEVK